MVHHTGLGARMLRILILVQFLANYLNTDKLLPLILFSSYHL